MNTDPYSEPTSLRAMAEAYGRGASLDAKWEVMRRYGTSQTSFEEWLINKLPLPPGTRILDVGAGSGRFAIPLARRLKALGGVVVALDVLESVMDPIHRAVEGEGLPIVTVLGNANRLEDSLGTFDIVLGAHMLYHLDDVVAGVESMRRRLATDGLFVATTNASVGMPDLFALHVATMQALGLPCLDGPPPGRFTLENGAERLSQVFDSVGLDVYDGGFTAESADPVFAYWSSTELYRSPMRDESIPLDTRLQLAPVFVHLTQTLIEKRHEPLLIRKEVGAFLCRWPEPEPEPEPRIP